MENPDQSQPPQQAEYDDRKSLYSCTGPSPVYQIPIVQRGVDYRDTTPPLKRIFWPTNQILLEFENSKRKLIINLGDFLLVLLFSMTTMVVIFNQVNHSNYDMDQLVRQMFGRVKIEDGPKNYLKFKDISRLEHVYKYLNVAMVEGQWLDHFYGPERARMKQLHVQKDYVHVIGVPQIRQVRSMNDSCIIDRKLYKMMKVCYGYTEPAFEQTTKIRQRLITTIPEEIYLYNNISRSFSFQSPSKFTTIFYGRVGTYAPGGFFINVTRGSQSDSWLKKRITFLQKAVWLDRGTRAVFIELVLFCPNTNLMSQVRVAMEISSGGGVVPSIEVKTGKLFMMVSYYDYLIMGCIFFLVLMAMFYVIEEVREVLFLRIKYFFLFGTYLDIAIIITCLTSFFQMLYIMRVVATRLDKVAASNQELYISFEDILDLKMSCVKFLILTLFLSCIKLFRYLPYFGSISKFSKTLNRGQRAISFLVFNSLYFFMIYTSFGYLLYQTRLEDYSTWPQTALTVLRQYMYYGDYPRLWNLNPFLGSCYFIFYVFFMFWFQISFIWIIIYHHYNEADQEVVLLKGSAIHRMCCAWCIRLRRLICFQYRKHTLMQVPAEHLNAEDLRYIFKRLGFTKPEIDVFFYNYEIDENKLMSPYEISRVIHSFYDHGLLGRITFEPPRGFDFADKSEKYTQLGPKEYRTLLRRISRLEIKVETLCERTNTVKKMLRRGHDINMYGKYGDDYRSPGFLQAIAHPLKPGRAPYQRPKKVRPQKTQEEKDSEKAAKKARTKEKKDLKRKKKEEKARLKKEKAEKAAAEKAAKQKEKEGATATETEAGEEPESSPEAPAPPK